MKRKILLCIVLATLMLLGVVVIGPVGAPSTTIGVEPDSIIDPGLGPGSTFTVNITICDVVDLAGLEFKLAYNTTVLNATLITYGGIFGTGQFGLANEIHDDEGYLWYGVMAGFGKPPFSGDGLAATIDFTVDSLGDSVLHLYDTKLGDSSVPPEAIIHDALDGYFSNGVVEVGWIEGTVTDTLLPIEGATVSADGYSDVTDSSGFYNIEVPPDTYDVTALMTGYESQTVMGVSVSADETVVQDFALSARAFSLTITSGTGGTTDPPPGTYSYDESTVVTVTAIPDSGYFLDHWELDGMNVGDSNPIEVTMDADHTLHAVFSELPPLTVEVSADPTTVYSGGTSTITVLVTSEDTPVLGATVTLSSDEGGNFSSMTDQGNGYYTATFTAPTVSTSTTVTITAEASKSGYTSGQGQTQVTVQPLVLNIYVKDADGNPIADATVVSTAQPSGQAPISGTTDANGLVVFTGILKGSYTIKASKTGYEDKTGTVTVIAGQATTDTVTPSKLAEAPGFPLMWIAIAIILIVVVTVGAVFAIKKTRTPKP